MGKMIKFELSKLKNQKSLFICTGIMLASLLLNVFTYWAMESVMSEELGSMGDMGVIVGFDMITSVLQAANNGSLTLIAGIVISIFVCSDYSQGTIKNIIARGYSRTTVYFAKLLAVCVMTAAMFLVCVLFGFIFGTAFFGFTAPAGARWLGMLAVQLVATVAFSAFAFFFSNLFRKMAPSIILIIVVPTVVQVVLTLIDIFAKTNLSDYWITSVFASLATVGVSTSRILISLAASLLYVAAFVASGWALGRKTSY